MTRFVLLCLARADKLTEDRQMQENEFEESIMLTSTDTDNTSVQLDRTKDTFKEHTPK